MALELPGYLATRAEEVNAPVVPRGAVPSAMHVSVPCHCVASIYAVIAPLQQPFSSYDEVPLDIISTVEELNEAIEELCSPEVHEVAVDLENHNYRSYQGFLCLMQLSTRSKDYIIDCLKLRDHVSTMLAVERSSTGVYCLFSHPRLFLLFLPCLSDEFTCSAVHGRQRVEGASRLRP